MEIVIEDYIDLSTKGYHNASSYQVALDENFEHIIDQTIKDKINVKSWHTMLPKIDGTGYYADLDKVYARVKVFIDNDESPWFTVVPLNQNDQTMMITEEGKETLYLNSIENNFN